MSVSSKKKHHESVKGLSIYACIEALEHGFQQLIDRYTPLHSEQEQLRYLPQSVKLEESINPHVIRFTMMLISVFMLAFIVWAAFTPVSEVTATSGQIVPKGHVQLVQHLDGGMIIEILAGNGDIVEEGQLLLSMDDGGAEQDVTRERVKLRALQIEAERLDALINKRTTNFKQFSTPASQQSEDMVFADVASMKRYSSKLKENLGLAREALILQQKLFNKGLTTRVNLLSAEKGVSDIESSAYETLTKVETDIAQIKEVITKLERRVARLQVRAPVRGLVKGLEVNTIGSIVEPGETLMEIVPLESEMIANVRISPKDIGHIRTGQQVRVRVSSYDFARYGAVPGILDYISATTFLDEKQQPYYRGRIALLQNYVGRTSGRNIILPGMTVESDIITGEKTILAYLFKPIQRSLDSALSER